MISFIIPAHDEAALLGGTLDAIHTAARAVTQSYEIIVANDSSTDRTGDVARAGGARVVNVNHRKIAATRNTGARAATGDRLVFVDADTRITERALAAALRALRNGAVGGGSLVRFHDPVPFYARVLERAILPLAMPLLGLAGGCFLFCTRRAYDAVGGFDETLFWSEEVTFANRLKRLGRFKVVREYVFTSGRKLQSRSLFDLIRVGVNLAKRRPEALDYWYGPRRS